jgi:hypothetical protein
MAVSIVPARADPVTPNLVGVFDQARYNDLPQAHQIGSVIYSPSVSLHETYDDNIYARPTDTKSDLITDVNPSLNVNSDLDMYNFGFNAIGDFGYYANHSSENYDDYTVSGHGGWSMDTDTSLNASESESHLHEARTDPDDPGGDHPVEYHLSTQAVNFTRAPSAIKLYIDAERDALNYEDSTKDGTIIDNSGRDRDVYSLRGKLAYEFAPGYELFGSVGANQRHYLNTGTNDRNSNGSDAEVGTDVYLTGKLKGNLYVGDIRQSYGSGLPDIDAPDYGGSLLWNVDQLTSVLASVNREIDETTFVDVAGSIDTNANLTIQHSLRPNLFVVGVAGLTNSQYQAESSVPNRRDRDYAGGASLDYLPTGHVSADLNYRYTDRRSTDTTQNFNDNQVTATLTLGF